MDITWGKITPEELGDFCKSMGRKDPLNTVLNWKIDIDRGIISLSKKTGWADALRDGMSDAMILHLARSNSLSNMQRDLVNQCILKDCCKICKDTGYGKSKLCYCEGIISRIRRYLNKEILKQNGRDEQGRFKKDSVDKLLESLNFQEVK